VWREALEKLSEVWERLKLWKREDKKTKSNPLLDKAAPEPNFRAQDRKTSFLS